MATEAPAPGRPSSAVNGRPCTTGTPSTSKNPVETKPANVRRGSPPAVSRTPTVPSVWAVTPVNTSRRAANTSKAPCENARYDSTSWVWRE